MHSIPMIKNAFSMLVVFGVVFGAGYYFDELNETFHTMLRDDVVERTREGSPDLRKEFMEAKARFLDSRTDILDGKYEKARTEMEATLRHLRKTMTMKGAEHSKALLADVMKNIAGLRQALADGQGVATDTLRDAEEELDALLDRAR